MRQAPSMTGLRVLEAVLRNGSLSAAARELCVTPAAISHRLRSLEAQGKAALVRRDGGRFVATDVGQRVLDQLGDAFQRIRAADAILSEARTQTLHISASYSFAVLWLAPRLSQFRDQHPAIELHLEPSHSPLQNSDANVVILHATQPPDQTGWTQLCAETCVAVARSNHPLFNLPKAGPADVLGAKLVHIAHGKGPEPGEFTWQTWAGRLGLAVPVPSNPRRLCLPKVFFSMADRVVVPLSLRLSHDRSHAGSGGARNRVMVARMARTIAPVTATSASWNLMARA